MSRPFHHGNLRTVLLDRAEDVLRAQGVDALSLRELAREAGVSHGAPRSHFVDRNALLDALAERGFLRLADEISTAAAGQIDVTRAVRAACSAYLTFATSEAALLDLMFAAKIGRPTDAVDRAASRLFEQMGAIMSDGARAGAYPSQDVHPMTLLLTATVQGIASLVTARRFSMEQGTSVIDDLIARLMPDGSS
jgi:AcrR family transcriptional regulator